MHEELIERRLSVALHGEADVLPFTITAAELERRLALRRRSFAGRRLTLLLAAAVGISLFGVGGALSGLFNPSLPIPTQVAIATVAPPPSAPASTLPSLSPTPPVALTRQLPGWKFSGGLGPDYAVETTSHSFTGAGVGEDHIQVVVACGGTAPIEVAVEDGITQTFSAACTPDGNTTTQLLHVTEQGVRVRYIAPKGTWTALSILVPSN